MTLLVLNCQNLDLELVEGWQKADHRVNYWWDDAVQDGYAILGCESRAFESFSSAPASIINKSVKDFSGVHMVVVNHNNGRDGHPQYSVYTRQP